MQGGGEGAVKTMPAPTYLPLLGDPAGQARGPYRPPRQAAHGSNYYSKTKRKRDSSSCSGRSDSPGAVDPGPCPPWHNTLYPYSRGVIGLHEEIEDFFQWMVPSPEEHQMRVGVVDRIQLCIQEIWPQAQVHIFGSFKTGLYLPTSDIDLVVVGLWDSLPLRTLERRLLERSIADPSTLKVLDKASVPIIKLTDRMTQIKVDISFNMANGLKSVELVKLYRKQFPPLQKLICVLKQFLLQRDLNEVFTGGLSSYCLILMVVSFLQLHPRNILNDPAANLGVLLIEFFELYSRKFNYMTTAIRVRGEGSYITKEEVQEQMPPGHRPSLLCIEDPLQPGNDVGKSSYGALQVKQAFDYAYGQLTRATRGGGGGTALSRIVQVDMATIQYRAWIQQAFPILEEPDQSPTPPLPGTRTLPPLDLEDGASESSSGSPGSCRSSSPDPGDHRASSAERGSSPECGRSSPPPTSPTSAMSISPASSEVGTRVGSAATSITSSSPPSSTGRSSGGNGGWQTAQYGKSRNHNTWRERNGVINANEIKKPLPPPLPQVHPPLPRQCPRSDLDHNWRASASGPPSDRSSNSGSEAGGREWRAEQAAVEKKLVKTVAAETDIEMRRRANDRTSERTNDGRSDRDTNWREHGQPQPPAGKAVKEQPEPEVVTALPPSGCKKTDKNRVNGNQRTADKGAGKALIKTALKAIENEAKAAKNGHNIAEAAKHAEPAEPKAPQEDRLKAGKEKSRTEAERRKAENAKAAAADSKAEAVRAKQAEERTKAEQVASRVKPTEPKDNKSDYQLVEGENGAVKRKKKTKKKKSERPTCMSSTKAAESSANELKSKSEKNDSNAKSNSSSKPNAGNRFSCDAGPRLPKR